MMIRFSIRNAYFSNAYFSIAILTEAGRALGISDWYSLQYHIKKKFETFLDNLIK